MASRLTLVAAFLLAVVALSQVCEARFRVSNVQSTCTGRARFHALILLRRLRREVTTTRGACLNAAASTRHARAVEEDDLNDEDLSHLSDSDLAELFHANDNQDDGNQDDDDETDSGADNKKDVDLAKLLGDDNDEADEDEDAADNEEDAEDVDVDEARGSRRHASPHHFRRRRRFGPRFLAILRRLRLRRRKERLCSQTVSFTAKTTPATVAVTGRLHRLCSLPRFKTVCARARARQAAKLARLRASLTKCLPLSYSRPCTTCPAAVALDTTPAPAPAATTPPTTTPTTMPTTVPATEGNIVVGIEPRPAGRRSGDSNEESAMEVSNLLKELDQRHGSRSKATDSNDDKLSALRKLLSQANDENEDNDDEDEEELADEDEEADGEEDDDSDLMRLFKDNDDEEEGVERSREGSDSVSQLEQLLAHHRRSSDSNRKDADVEYRAD